MKISNETKVGAIAVVAVTLLILGFNFLKGKKLFSSSKDIIARFENVQGLTNSNPVMVNGLQVGTVYSLSPSKDMRQILVTLNITSDINIPANSLAVIKPSLLGITSLDINLGDAQTYLKHKDTINTMVNAGTLDNILKKVDPVLFEVTNAVSSLDSFLKNMNSIVDPRAKNNIGSALDNLNKITTSLTLSAASLEILLNTQTGTMAKTLNNLSSVTGNLASNNDKITGVITNLDKTATNLSQLDLKGTLDSLNGTISNLKLLVGKLNSNDGTIGLLLNDPNLYKNLASTANKLNLLIDDVRVNPKRYVNISILGKKNSSPPLSYPLPDTVNSPYIIEKAKN
ncbi:MAG: MCE family protein [Ferruginibacter sp.]|nr:MCE family protein [Ferruginibacter sp.]